MELNRLQYETALWEKGFNNIAGVDEVGRGCIAGPLVTAAVVLNKKHIQSTAPEILDNYLAIKDSKLLSAKKRETLSAFILDNAYAYAIETIDVNLVDSIGIAQATQMGFFNSINNLKVKVDHILSDAFEIKGVKKVLQTNIKKGDNLSITIAAASIIAKVYRDKLMVIEGEKYSSYYFEEHKGYGTKKHLEAVKNFGPCAIHRKSFEPIKSFLLTT